MNATGKTINTKREHPGRIVKVRRSRSPESAKFPGTAPSRRRRTQERFQQLEMCAELQDQGTFSICEVSRAVMASGVERAERAKLESLHGTGDSVMAIGHRCSGTCLRVGWGVASGRSTKNSNAGEEPLQLGGRRSTPTSMPGTWR